LARSTKLSINNVTYSIEFDINPGKDIKLASLEAQKSEDVQENARDSHFAFFTLDPMAIS